MRIKVLVIFIFGFWVGLKAQKKVNYYPIDNVILLIPDSLTNSTQGIANFINLKFSNQSDKSRAIFIWVAINIQYDIDNMFAINFYQNTNEIIDKTLKTRKGICMNFAELFNDIANKVGIKSYVIDGYTKQNGFVDYIPHAWCAANVDSIWYMFDPTWGSGYVKNSRFIKKINNFYYKIKPEQLIKSHMPFDPLWQFLNYPITNQEFYEGKTQINKNKPYFNFIDTLSNYEKQSAIDQLISSSVRIEMNGVKNSLVFDRLQYDKREVEYYKNKQVVEQFNSSTNFYNIGTNLLNEFINYRNHQFTPKKSDSEIKLMIDTVETSFQFSRKQLENIKNPDSNTTLLIVQLNKSLDNANINLTEQKAFLSKYFKTSKIKRNSLFYAK
jgi:Transglutaminase-like superfamily